jgi:hypothetical protein
VTKEQLADMVGRAERAGGIINALNHREIHWRMSVPARPDSDPDIVISKSLADIPYLAAEVDNLQYKCEKLLQALRRINVEAAVLQEVDPATNGRWEKVANE